MRKVGTSVQPQTDEDRGTALILALCMIVIGALIVLPMLNYAMTISRSGRVQTNSTVNEEAVKAGLLVALANPKSLYSVCSGAGLTSSEVLGSPPGFDVETECSWVDAVPAVDNATLWYSATTTQSGSSLPTGVAEANGTFAASGAPDPTAWLNGGFTSPTPAGSKIWLPDLPAIDTRHGRRSTRCPLHTATAPSTSPGKYTDPLEITGPGKTYFANGIYYFENTVTIKQDADVVVGDGSVEGCTDTPDAVLYGEDLNGDAVDTPAVNGGVGGTFVFGKAGRLVIDNSTTTTALSVIFNKRFVQEGEASTASSAGVSIMTVNGLLNTNGTTIDPLNNGTVATPVPNQSSGGVAPGTVFKPSTLVPPDLAAAATLPVLLVNLPSLAQVTISIPGYVAAPQGIVKVQYAAGMTSGKNVKINGGVLGAQILVSADRPDADPDPASTFVIGLENPTVQQTFKITSTSQGGSPNITGTAIVQVNQSGVAWVNSYVIQ